MDGKPDGGGAAGEGVWETLKDLGHTLAPCRFSALSLALGAVVLFQLQVQDLLRAMVDHLPHRSAKIVQLLAAVFIWGHTNWYFARVMLYFRFPGTPPHTARRHALASWLPRILGAGAMFVFGMACLAAARPLEGQAARKLVGVGATGIAMSLAFLAFVHHRRRVSRRLGRALPPRPGRNLDAQLGRLSRATFIYLGISIALGVLLLVGFWAAAPVLAPAFGPLALVLLIASVWVPLGSALVYLGSRFDRPVISVVIAVAIVFSCTTDNHALRTAADAAGTPAPPPAARQFAAWLGALPDRPARPGDAPAAVPAIFVAAEGGGIRAAYWTSKVLAGLEDDGAAFGDHLFAVSAVSGGSLGAVVFDALLADRQAGRLPPDRNLVDQAKGVLGEDFLSPVLAAMLFPDAFVHLVPGSAGLTSADRARALEASWERSWRAHVGTDRLAAPFRSLWSGGGRIPHLLLNTTCAETGRRFVVSDLAMAPRIGDVGDALDVVGADVPLSTAAHLSARFPYLSPGGRVMAHPERCGHFVDGGYFENSGAATLLDLMEALPDEVPHGAGSVGYVPIVISINNDPDRDRAPVPTRFLSELLIPLRTLLETRGARGRSAEIGLAKYVTGETTLAERPAGCQALGDDAHGYYIEFALSRRCNVQAPPGPAGQRPPGTVPVPLGWMLSGAAQEQMDCQWQEQSCLAVRHKIRELLTRTP